MLRTIIAFMERHRSSSRKIRHIDRNRLECRFEKLECRNLLAIDWTNRGTIGDDSDNFEGVYRAANALIAREIVDRAIHDWKQ